VEYALAHARRVPVRDGLLGLPSLAIVLQLGISFFTFTQIAFLADTTI